MNRLTKHIIVIALAVIIGGVVSGTVHAQETETETETPETTVTTQERTERAERTERTQEARETREQRVKKVERSLEKCEQIKTRLAERVSKATEVQTAHMSRYERLVNRLDAVIASAESRGYDSAGLITAKEAVVAAIAAYEITLDAYREQLGETSEVACDQDANVYGQAIVTSRENLEAVRTAGALVRTTFRETVVPELQEYKAWLEDNATATEESAE